MTMPRGRPTLDLTGQRFGKLVAVSCLGMVNGYRKWACDCDCGRRDVLIKQGNLTGGNTRSCGCMIGHPGAGSEYGRQLLPPGHF
jgi:hypothetical protein